MLLERQDVDPNLEDTKDRRTPLAWAARNGHERVVKMLLERTDLNPNQGDIKYCQTPLSPAARGGHEEIVKMLLQRGDVNPNQADTRTGRTPLSWAMERGNEGVVKLLSELKAGHNAKPDKRGLNRLSSTFSKGYDSVARTIQEWDYPKSDRADHSSLARYPPSAQHGDECVVEMQPRGNGPNIRTRDLNAQRTLLSAKLDKRDLVLDLEDSIPQLPEGGLPSAIASVPPKPPSVWRLKFRRLQMKTRTRFNRS